VERDRPGVRVRVRVQGIARVDRLGLGHLEVAPRRVERVEVRAAGQCYGKAQGEGEQGQSGAHVVSCSVRTSSGPFRMASIPETPASAPAMVVIVGTPWRSAVARMALSSYCEARPSGVLMTSVTSPEATRSTTSGLPSCTLNTVPHSSPFSL